MRVQVISPFLDPVTRSKIVFISDSTEGERRVKLANLVSAGAVEACAGGNPSIDPESYGHRMRKLDADRSAMYEAFLRAQEKLQ